MPDDKISDQKEQDLEFFWDTSIFPIVAMVFVLAGVTAFGNMLYFFRALRPLSDFPVAGSIFAFLVFGLQVTVSSLALFGLWRLYKHDTRVFDIAFSAGLAQLSLCNLFFVLDMLLFNYFSVMLLVIGLLGGIWFLIVLLRGYRLLAPEIPLLQIFQRMLCSFGQRVKGWYQQLRQHFPGNKS